MVHFNAGDTQRIGHVGRFGGRTLPTTTAAAATSATAFSVAPTFTSPPPPPRSSVPLALPTAVATYTPILSSSAGNSSEIAAYGDLLCSGRGSSNRVAREINSFLQSSIDWAELLGCKDGCLYASFKGPMLTPYEHGIFVVSIKYDASYPFKPMKVRFVTPVFHPNISTSGDVDNVMFKDNWSPAHTLCKVMVELQQHMSRVDSPHGAMPLGSLSASTGPSQLQRLSGLEIVVGGGMSAAFVNGAVGKQFLEDPGKAENDALFHTLLHATYDAKQMVLASLL